MSSPLNNHSESCVNSQLTSNQTHILKGILGLVVSSILTIIIILISFVFKLFNNTLLVSSLAVCISLIFITYFIVNYQKNKKKIISLKTLIKYFPELGYHDSSYVSLYKFCKSQLYDEVDFNYSGNDLLNTKNWELSNLRVKYTGSANNNEKKVFKGCFVYYKRTFDIGAPIVIKPKHIGQSSPVTKVQNHLINPYFNPKMEFIESGNKTFDQIFTIHTVDQVSTMNFLSVKKLNDILNFHQKLNHIIEIQSSRNKNRIFKPENDKSLNALELSFHSNGVYLAIREQNIFKLSEINTKHYNIILELINFLDNI